MMEKREAICMKSNEVGNRFDNVTVRCNVKTPSTHVTKKCGHHRIHQLLAVHIQSESVVKI